MVGRKSAVGRLLALVGRLGLCQLLCAVSSRARVVVGDVLACGRRDELDYRAMDTGGISNTQSFSRPSDRADFCSLLDLLFWSVVGTGRIDVWLDDAVSRAFPWHVCRSRLYGGVWNSRPTHFP